MDVCTDNSLFVAADMRQPPIWGKGLDSRDVCTDNSLLVPITRCLLAVPVCINNLLFVSSAQSTLHSSAMT